MEEGKKEQEGEKEGKEEWGERKEEKMTTRKRTTHTIGSINNLSI